MPEVDAKVIDATHLELSEAIQLKPGESVKVSIHDLGKSNQHCQANPAHPQASVREREQAWCRANQDVLRSYSGQWVVLEGEEIIAHGTDPLNPGSRSKVIHLPLVVRE